MKISNNFNISNKFVNFKSEENIEIPSINQNESFINDDFIKTIPTKKSNFNTKDILLTLGFLGSATVAGVAIHKNKNLNESLKKALEKLNISEKNQQELKSKLEEINKKVQDKTKEAVENLKKTSKRKTETQNFYKNENFKTTSKKTVPENNLKTNNNKIFSSNKQENIQIFDYKLTPFISEEERGYISKIIKKSAEKETTPINIQIKEITIETNKDISFWDKLKLNFEIFLFNLKTRKNLDVDKKAFLNTSENHTLKLDKAPESYLKDYTYNSKKPKIQDINIQDTNEEKTNKFVHKIKQNIVALFFNLKTRKNLNTDKKAFLNTSENNTLNLNNVAKIDLNQKSNFNWFDFTKKEETPIKIKTNKVSKKDRIFAKKKKALEDVKRNQKTERKTGKWGRKFNNKYKAQNVQPKQTKEIKPKRSLRQKIKNFFSKLFDDKDI